MAIHKQKHEEEVGLGSLPKPEIRVKSEAQLTERAESSDGQFKAMNLSQAADNKVSGWYLVNMILIF